MKKFLMVFILFIFVSPVFALVNVQIKQLIIEESIANYSGNCACPYNLASNGSLCGRRSAYSKPGGYSPICYPSDVTPEMVKQYKKTHKIK